MNKLNQLGITVGKDNKAEIVFDSLFPSFLTVKYKKPSDYISTYWEAFKKHPEGNNNLNGKIFEYILATLFVRENILTNERPFYLFETPPKRILKTLETRLFQAKLVPSATLYFGWSDLDTTTRENGPFLNLV